MVHFLRSIIVLAVTATSSLFGQAVLPVEDGPIHEAFVSRDTENFEFDVVRIQPPAPINERIPPQVDRQAVWIPGYWSWDEKRNDFIWLSGVWRRPPPGHYWTAGTWRPMREGWVWTSGFWSPQPANTMSYIDMPPPEAIDENIIQPRGGEYFWSPGYWEYSERGRGYAWVSGHWERLDPNWILVPSHYVWYNDQYVFVPAYWDWKLEDRGTAFSPVYIAPPFRTTIVYQPVFVVENPIIVRRLFAFYPDYIGVCIHHQRFHPEIWGSFCRTPPWWGSRAYARRQVVSTPGRRQPIDVRVQDPRRQPVRTQIVDRSGRQQPGARANVPEKPRSTVMNSPGTRVQPGTRATVERPLPSQPARRPQVRRCS